MSTEKQAQSLSVNTLWNTCKNLQLLSGEMIKNMLEYQNDDETKEICDEYLDVINEMSKSINRLNINEDDKKVFETLFNTICSKTATNECKNLIIQKLQDKLQQVIQMWQSERDQYNNLASKYDEDQKNKTVELESISVSLSLKNRNITDKEIAEIHKSVNSYSHILNDDKYKRVTVHRLQNVSEQSKDNISRIYAKKADTNIIKQKIKN